MRWRSFVAVGDSFTEGLDDPDPSGAGYRGWADLVARHLSVVGGSDFRYANLAVRGRLFDHIATEQLTEALAQKPDLISFAGGGNDVLRRSVDVDAMLSRFDGCVAAMRASGADVVLFRFADVSRRLPGRAMILPRVQVLNEAVGEVASRRGAFLVDLWHDRVFDNSRLWSADRLHLSAAGHRRVAARVLEVLGERPDPSWLMPPDPPARHGWLRRRAHDAAWAGQYLAPWVKRRLLGRSSGDGVEPKRPALMPVMNDRSGSGLTRD